MTKEAIDAYFHEIYEAILRSLAEGNGGPFGAGLAADGKLIAVGTNHVLAETDVSRHAEVETLALATKKLGTVHIDGGVLLSSHFPCLMCYHAIKWANVKSGYYIFDYDETENLFGFKGDSAFLADLRLAPDFHCGDASVKWEKFDSPRIREDYYGNLVHIWNEKYSKSLGSYDV